MNSLISICIATFKRPKLLEELLTSIAKLKIPENLVIEIIIVDNDQSGSAHNVFEKFKKNFNSQIKYFIQPVKNISLARNACLENASGDYIAFIDDDETADPLWIQNLHDAMLKYGADGVFGYVEPVFDKKIPTVLKKREYYFSVVGQTGSKAKFYYTTNAMIKSELIKNEEIPFDPEYGLTGGEDVHLFERLEMKGAKFIVCSEAITYEYIPFERGNEKYLFIRALRGGQSFVRRKIELNKNYFIKFEMLLKSMIQLIYSSIFYTIFYFSGQYRVKFLLILGASVGKLRGIFSRFKIIY